MGQRVRQYLVGQTAVLLKHLVLVPADPKTEKGEGETSSGGHIGEKEKVIPPFFGQKFWDGNIWVGEMPKQEQRAEGRTQT
jgi:hypothetical protein